MVCSHVNSLFSAKVDCGDVHIKITYWGPMSISQQIEAGCQRDRSSTGGHKPWLVVNRDWVASDGSECATRTVLDGFFTRGCVDTDRDVTYSLLYELWASQRQHA